jgi:hypothetical protein
MHPLLDPGLLGRVLLSVPNATLHCEFALVHQCFAMRHSRRLKDHLCKMRLLLAPQKNRRGTQ